MNLTEELQNYRNQFLTKVSEEVQATMSQATQNLASSGISDGSLKVGDKVPDFSLPNATGKRVNLQKQLQLGPVVISFYRGQWCPYCNLELRAFQKRLPEIQALGASLIAISPQTPDNSLSTVEKNELTFEVLSDVGNHIARQFGLIFTLPEDLRPIYETFGIDLPAHNGDKTFELPIPATYVIASDGTIVLSFVNADYTQRLEPQEVINTLQKVNK
ncbi:peroxiredoxin-like family protein [Mastigocoleus testarum]|uniref:thioredoxin-dependent peroxiredoxin n=1 Tax=Mastigocoleus testarum BC008 TaxID=371196 RepID=A0A0V7ZYN9_9CYAN|nr:peroxiredoxin-like family protein [Mastigocoleus testarum]KST65201.1 alkyl hydroperoxide reductase [Mastigocoleus testarum BC008]KST69624.1 alkyl hydroperoxide reductase [Mastigocoleus testarum BC008]